jgi:peptidyl-tRNA hydrolase, PTH1 family
MAGIKLIVGLGNPGREYEATRHNAGFWWVDNLSDEMRVTLKPESKYAGLVARTQVDGQDVWLLEPQTFMNASGKAVGPLARFFKIAPEEILVVHDELDLPPGVIRLKKGGGHGGHNGLKDIVASIGSNEFWRLRIGIGHPGSREKVLGYVLGVPQKEEGELISEAIGNSLRLAPQIIRGDCEAAMQALHTRTKPAKE